MNRTIEYYNKNAEAFHERTKESDQSVSYVKFLALLTSGAHILDAGCGSGRDSIYFLNQGYQLSAFDASEAMVALSTRLTGIDVKLHTFQDMPYENAFDAIWAQASLLHVPYAQTVQVFTNIHRALKPGGIFYGSYKYGYDPMPTETRDFWLMDEERLKEYLGPQFELIETYTRESHTNVDPSPYKMWLHFLARAK